MSSEPHRVTFQSLEKLMEETVEPIWKVVKETVWAYIFMPTSTVPKEVHSQVFSVNGPSWTDKWKEELKGCTQQRSYMLWESQSTDSIHSGQQNGKEDCDGRRKRLHKKSGKEKTVKTKCPPGQTPRQTPMIDLPKPSIMQGVQLAIDPKLFPCLKTLFFALGL